MDLAFGDHLRASCMILIPRKGGRVINIHPFKIELFFGGNFREVFFGLCGYFGTVAVGCFIKEDIAAEVGPSLSGPLRLTDASNVTRQSSEVEVLAMVTLSLAHGV
ncbi:hypothetical protein BDW66DRAFT_143316 [Aspergillus desertorum]